jgi:hypothetical protein
MIDANPFWSCSSRHEVIKAFQQCSSIFRIEHPTSAEIVSDCSFNKRSFKERVFPRDGRLRILGGFAGSVSVCRLEIPVSVAIV